MSTEKKYKLKRKWLWHHSISGAGATYGAGLGLVQSKERPDQYFLEASGGVYVPASIVEYNPEWFEEVIEQTTEVRKEFVWDDNTVNEFVNLRIHDGNPNVETGLLNHINKVRMIQFKQSHTPTEQEQYAHDLIKGAEQKPIQDKDWEILEMVGLSGIPHKPTPPHITYDTCEDKGCKIHSVKRLSDGLTFTVGDMVGYDNGNTRTKKDWAIDNFFVRESDNVMLARSKDCINVEIVDKWLYKNSSPNTQDKPTEQPKERIEVTKIVTMKQTNKGGNEPRIDIYLNQWPDPYKHEAIKQAIEEILNGEEWKIIYTQEEMDEEIEKAFNAAREWDNYSSSYNITGGATSPAVIPPAKQKFTTAKDYLHSLNQ